MFPCFSKVNLRTCKLIVFKRANSMTGFLSAFFEKGLLVFLYKKLLIQEVVMRVIKSWKEKAMGLKKQIQVIYLAYKDPRTPCYIKILAGLVVAYAFSPIDLIPDFIPVLGYLDDLLLIPIGVGLVIKLIPKEILSNLQEKAKDVSNQNIPRNWVGAILIGTIWVIIVILVGITINEKFHFM